LVGGGLCVIKLIVLIFFNENDKYDYGTIDVLLDDKDNREIEPHEEED